MTDFRQIYKGLNKCSDQGNLLKGIVIWLVAARSVVQSPARALEGNFNNTFFISTFTPFQLLQIVLAIYRLPLRISLWIFLKYTVIP